MKAFLKNIIIGTLVIAAMTITGCTDPEESMSWRPGNGLHIIGAAEVPAGATPRNYYVDGFTIKETYTWTVNGSPVTPIRGGEFISQTFTAPGNYVITVTNGKLSGEMTVTVF